MDTPKHLTATKPRDSLGALWNLLSQLPLMGFTDGNKNITLVNKRIGRGKGRAKGFPKKVEIFKQLLWNKANKANIDRSETKRKKKGESHRICPAG